MLKNSSKGIFCSVVLLRFSREVPGSQHPLAQEGAERNVRPWLGRGASRQALNYVPMM